MSTSGIALAAVLHRRREGNTRSRGARVRRNAIAVPPLAWRLRHPGRQRNGGSPCAAGIGPHHPPGEHPLGKRRPTNIRRRIGGTPPREGTPPNPRGRSWWPQAQGTFRVRRGHGGRCWTRNIGMHGPGHRPCAELHVDTMLEPSFVLLMQMTQKVLDKQTEVREDVREIKARLVRLEADVARPQVFLERQSAGRNAREAFATGQPRARATLGRTLAGRRQGIPMTVASLEVDGVEPGTYDSASCLAT